MNKNNIIFGVVGLLFGLAIGFFVANSINENAVNNTTAGQIPNAPFINQQQGTMPQGQTPQGGMQADVQKTLDRAENEPTSFVAQVEAGRMYAQIQNFDKALEFFQKAHKLKPDDFQSNALLGNAFFDARQFENAETYYRKALEIKPNDVTVQSDLATTFFQRNDPDYKRAIQEFEKALQMDPKHEPTLFNLGLAYKRMGDDENAKNTLERLKKEKPDSDLIQRLEKVLDTKQAG